MSKAAKYSKPNYPHVLGPRPFATYYYAAVRDSKKDYSKIGHATTVIGAVRAAMLKIMMGEYSTCNIYNMNSELLMATVSRKGKQIITTLK